MTLTGTSAGSTTTDGSGFYQFLSLAGGGNYTVVPSKVRRTPGSAGINTVDVVAEQNHALSRVLLTGCRLAAGEAAGGAGINTVDVLAIQAFALGRTIPAQIGNVGIYSFTPANRTYTALSSSQTNQNFDTLILGDVANPVANPRPGGPAPDMATGPVATVKLPDISVARSMANFTAPVTTTVIDASSNLVAFQADITFDERAITFAARCSPESGTDRRKLECRRECARREGTDPDPARNRLLNRYVAIERRRNTVPAEHSESERRRWPVELEHRSREHVLLRRR